MAVTVPFTILALYFVQNVYLKTSRQLRFMDLEAKSPLYSHFLETLDGLASIRAFGWQQTSRDVNIKALDRSQRPYYLLYCVQRWLNLVLDLLVAGLAVAVVTLAVELRGSTSAGLLGIAMNNLLSFNASLTQLVTFWTTLETSLGAIARVKTFAESTESEERPEETFTPPDQWPESGSIEFCNLSAAYNDTSLALDGVNLSIAPGEKVGICGRTGSGKSSLLMTLLRLLDIQSGSILIDGLDLKIIPRQTIRSRMIAIPQDPFLLSGSVRLNADPSGKLPDEAIIEALSKIQLWSAVESRGGLDSQMQDQPLSQGQQQLFCLARAMLRKSKIVILDEATSSVDAQTDMLMQKVIREEFNTHTIITVAHRVSITTPKGMKTADNIKARYDHGFRQDRSFGYGQGG
jgi:ATP-binding cassette subfamily C (CFTR/MRP) protein 1